MLLRNGPRLAVVISLFLIFAFFLLSLRPQPPAPFAATSTAESVDMKPSARVEPVIVNPVGQAGANMPLNGTVDGAQGRPGFVHKVDGVAVNKQHGDAGSDVGRKSVRLDKQARKANNVRDLAVAPQGNVKRQHRALAKPHKGKLAIVKAKRRKFAVKNRRRLARTAPALRQLAKRKLKPSPATVGGGRTDFWSVW